jgi:hypothetical protein
MTPPLDIVGLDEGLEAPAGSTYAGAPFSLVVFISGA